ncbi:MAG: nucleotide exchange factor GrpE [Ruminococcaceae bacterium]|nr:nucleotide exchange factor GrpE [Oscillospiraceae bacterium]
MENKNISEENVSDVTEEIKTTEKESKNDKKTVKKLEEELEDVKKELEKATEALTDANNKYLTMLAEYDNFRRRSAKEKESTYSDAYADVLSNILPVIDNLERAAAYGDGENVSKGLEMTLRSFAEIMEKMGVKEIESLGKTFDPNVHNAVMHTEDESLGEQEISEVLQKGYMLGDKVLRYAMVKVAN